jgi:DNA-binding transcriptional ArsR family regulator
MRLPNHPSVDSLTITRVLHALSDPARLAIVKNLAGQGPQACGSLCSAMTMAKSTASHHFRVLREAGVIQMQPEGTQFINSLRCEDLNNRFPGLLDAVLQSAEEA